MSGEKVTTEYFQCSDSRLNQIRLNRVKYKKYPIPRDKFVHSSTSNVYDILVDQGATLNRALFLKTSAKRAIDLSNYTGRMQIRDYINSSVIVEILTTENGQVTIYGDTGRIDIILTPSETEALDAKNYVYDLEVESPEGDVTRVVSGKLTVRAEITY